MFPCVDTTSVYKQTPCARMIFIDNFFANNKSRIYQISHFVIKKYDQNW